MIGARGRRWRRRKTVGLAAVLVTLLATATSYLGDTGTAAPAIQPAVGAPADGAVADVTAMSSSVTRSRGQAHLDAGVALARLEVTPALANQLRVTVGWQNASVSGAIFANPNVQLSIGLYHLVSQGACPPTTGQPDPVAPAVTLTDTDTQTYCAALDSAATGSPSVSSSGKLFLTRQIESGYLDPSLPDSAAPSSLPACGTAVSWCQPASVAGPTAVLYLIASITTPQGAPVGLQDTISSMTFFVGAAGS